MAPTDLTLSDLQRSKSRSFTYRVIEEPYSVDIYFLVVFLTLVWMSDFCTLLADGVFRCPSGLSGSNCILWSLKQM